MLESFYDDLTEIMEILLARVFNEKDHAVIN